jgi:RNA polymerase sigma factor (sigma-70 family)
VQQALFAACTMDDMLSAALPENRARGERRASALRAEAALIDRVAGRDGAAFEALYRGYYPRLRRFLERVTRRPQIVEEILNDTMFVVWRKAASYNGKSQVSTWIFGIAFKRALKALKRVDDPVAFEPDDRTDDERAGPEAIVAQQQVRASIARALTRLSPEQRAVIELTCLEGYSCAEVAEIMHCPVNTVKTRMFHARRRLRMLLPDDEGDAG